MKKIYSTLGLIALFFGANAQNASITTSSFQETVIVNQPLTSVLAPTTAILIPKSLGAGSTCTPVVYSGAGVGYLTGTSALGTRELAQRFVLSTYTLSTPASISNAIIQLGHINSTGGGSVTVRAYTDASGAPGSALGVSDSKALSSLSVTSPTVNLFTFSPAITIPTGTFYISVDITGLLTGDSIAIVSSNNGCALSNANDAFYKDATNNFSKFSAAPVNYTFDLGIVALGTAESVVGVKEINAISALSAFPNPANNNVTLSYNLTNTSNVEVTIYDVTGKAVKTITETATVGSNSTKVDLSSFESGIYMYSVKSGNNKAFGKFIVSK